jgi:hypothetical protein
VPTRGEQRVAVRRRERTTESDHPLALVEAAVERVRDLAVRVAEVQQRAGLRQEDAVVGDAGVVRQNSARQRTRHCATLTLA